MQSYIYWALLGMVGYSLTTLFTKLAERSGEVSSYMVLAVSSIIVPIFVIAIVGFRGELKPLTLSFFGGGFDGPAHNLCERRSRLNGLPRRGAANRRFNRGEVNVRYGSLADISGRTRDVRFTP